MVSHMAATRRPGVTRLSARAPAALLRRLDRIVPVLERARRSDPLARAGTPFNRSRALLYLVQLALDALEAKEQARKETLRAAVQDEAHRDPDDPGVRLEVPDLTPTVESLENVRPGVHPTLEWTPPPERPRQPSQVVEGAVGLAHGAERSGTQQV